jgi:hypothetical protein
MVLTALSPGAFTLLLLTVILVLATALTAIVVKLALTCCSPTCSDTDDEALECEYHSLDRDVEERKPDSRRRQLADRP